MSGNVGGSSTSTSTSQYHLAGHRYSGRGWLWAPCVFLCLLLLSVELLADDTELFVAELPAGAQPNVLLIMDTSGSMGIQTGERLCMPPPLDFICVNQGPTRMDIAKDAAVNFLQRAENINIGIMGFNTSSGGGVRFAFEDIDTGRQDAIDTIRHLRLRSFTPMTETLYEAYLYFSGQKHKFGLGGSFDLFYESEIDYTAFVNWSWYLPFFKHRLTYKSPIVNECQKSSIVLFTDGAPYLDTGADQDIRNLISGHSLPSGLNSRCSGEGECLDELAWYLANQDVNTDVPQKQTVNVYTIGGFGDAPADLLTRTANMGNGRYYEADNADELASALNDVMVRVSSGAKLFAAPTVSVSALNPLESSDDVYYTVFEPSEGPDWKGNLKRYRLGDDNQIYDANGKLAIDSSTGFFADGARSFWSSQVDGKSVDKGGVAEEMSPFRWVFSNLGGDRNINLRDRENHLDFSNAWQVPGSLMGVSGAFEKWQLISWASGMDIDDRDGDGSHDDFRHSIGDPLHTQPLIITYNKKNNFSRADKLLFFTTNDGFLHAVDTRTGVTTFSFIPTELLINLRFYFTGTVRPPVPASGPDSDDDCVWNYQFPGACVPARWCEERFEWGDIHASQSCRLIPPNPQSDDDCDWDWSRARCANSDYCKQKPYSFGDVPGDKLCRLRPANERPSPPPEPDPGPAKLYGMDGPMSAWVADLNGDGDLVSGWNPDPGEHAYLYLTMRRGGSNIYALDVTRRSFPKLKWIIKGDRDRNHQADSVSDNPEFPELGQTWSKVMVTEVKWQGRERKVLLFGGGYDQDADEQSKIEENDIGRAVYMVDAETGEMLWTADKSLGDLRIPEMKYSIPAELSLVDINHDGLTDYFFAVDIGGQLFRFDINPNNTLPGNFASGGLIASLSGNTTADARRFFEAPTVAIANNRDYLHIAIGSGTRPAPLGTAVNDRMYVIRDPNVYGKPSRYGYDNGSIIREGDLYDVTSNIIENGSQSQKTAALARLKASHGWYMRMTEPGEKILGKATILGGVLLFTSFKPQTSSNSCVPGVGLNFIYALDIENGGASILTQQLWGGPPSSVRRKQLTSRSLAPQPTVISRGGEMQVCIGTECLDNSNNQPMQEFGQRVKRTFWRENR